eukprot:3655992-Prymnesium_polylepis.1
MEIFATPNWEDISTSGCDTFDEAGPVTTPPPPSPPPCIDFEPFCSGVGRGRCMRSADDRISCPRTCGVCSVPVDPPPPAPPAPPPAPPPPRECRAFCGKLSARGTSSWADMCTYAFRSGRCAGCNDCTAYGLGP